MKVMGFCVWDPAHPTYMWDFSCSPDPRLSFLHVLATWVFLNDACARPCPQGHRVLSSDGLGEPWWSRALLEEPQSSDAPAAQEHEGGFPSTKAKGAGGIAPGGIALCTARAAGAGAGAGEQRSAEQGPRAQAEPSAVGHRHICHPAEQPGVAPPGTPSHPRVQRSI